MRRIVFSIVEWLFSGKKLTFNLSTGAESDKLADYENLEGYFL